MYLFLTPLTLPLSKIDQMKKLLLALIFTTTLIPANAQVNPHAIGIRFKGDNHAQGAEISYQMGLGEKNRLEFDFGGRRHRNWSHFNIACIYHWVNNITDGLNWYIGPGASIGSYRSKYWNNDGLTLAIGGQIGLEYDFNENGVPLLLSLDWRPMWGFFSYDEYDPFGYEGGLSLRYTF